MNRVASSARRPVTVAILFLCLLALTLCQVLGPTARLNHDFGPSDLAGSTLITVNERGSSAQIPLPSRCASIKLAPVEIAMIDLAPAGIRCDFVAGVSSAPPRSTELGVPTPPPRRA